MNLRAIQLIVLAAGVGVEAENSMGFHASQESVRILGESINFTRLGQLSLRGGVPATQGQQQAAALVVPSH